jgi:hypothetical protein
MQQSKSDLDSKNGQTAFEFEIRVLAKDATEEELDRITRDLLSEIKRTDVESVSLLSAGQGPHGSKGDLITIGALTMTALPIVLPGVVDIIKAWIARAPNRTVKFKGRGIDFEGTPEQLEKVLVALNKQRKKR